MRCKLFSVLVAACAITWGASTAAAQTSTGQITGTVLDQSGAVVPGAAIQITNTETGELVRRVESNEVGRFSAPLLRPGTYDVATELEGFKQFVQSDVQLRVDEVINLRLILEPGTVTEQVTVEAMAVQLEETTHSIGQVVGETTIQKLPLNGRNYLDLGNLTAGTVPNARSRDKTYSAYGNRGYQNAYLLDGARNVNYLRGLDNRQRDAMRPSLEAVEEFKVNTSNFSAEYGASAGAVVNVVTKSGTNEYHGSAFWFLRNDNLDARDYFAPPTTVDPLYIQHQAGGALGGPIVSNRVFWHAAYQRTHITEGTTLTGNVPLPAERAGEFGDRSVFDPFTTRAGPDGESFIRDQFENNMIPASRMDAAGRDLISRYPAPVFDRSTRNYVRAPNNGIRTDNLTARGDVRVSDMDSMFGRYSFNLPDFQQNAVFETPAGNPVVREGDAFSIGYGYTRTFSPSVVNEFRFAWNRIGVDQDGLTPRDEIIPGALDPGVTSGTPTFSLAGLTAIGVAPPGFGNLPLLKSSAVWNFSDNLSMVSGRHTTKLGFDYQMIRAKTSATLVGRGRFSFNGVFTQNPQGRPGTGSSVADLLLGLPNSITTGTRATAREQQQNLYWYFQDDWQVTSRLTLNLGVRYELTQPFIELDNRMANFILDAEDSLFGQLILAGDDRKPRSLLNTDMNNIAPRFGFAYRVADGLVIRGGYGVFYGQDEGTGVNRRMTNNPPFFGFGGISLPSDQLNPSSTIPLSSSLPARPDPIAPQDFVLNPRSTARLRSWSHTLDMPTIQQWNVSIQKQLAGSIMWEVNYVGNTGRQLYASYEGNQPTPGPGSPNNRRPHGEYTRARIFRTEPWATSSYHGISTRLEKRFSGGLSFLTAFTHGRSLDTASNLGNCDGCGPSGDYGGIQDTRNLDENRGPSNHNIPNRFVFSGVYSLPFTEGSLKHLLGGWDVSGIVTFSDGIPFTPALNFDNANTGTTSRPNRIRDGTLSNPTIDRYFDIDAFPFPQRYTFGDSGRNILYGPGTNMVNFALHRNFPLPLSETSKIEFRFEAFNFFNRPHFGLPVLSIGNRNAGVIGGTAQDNRQLQFGLKLLF